MTATLVLTGDMADELAAAASESLETAGVLLAKPVTAGSDLRLLGRRVHWVPDRAYRERRSDALSIASDGYVPALREAAEEGLLPIWLHTHPGPGAVPAPSVADAAVDEALADLFRLRADTPWYATLIVSPRPGGLGFTGRLDHEDGSVAAIGRLWQVGDAWRLVRAFDVGGPAVEPLFERHVRAFGPAIQAALGDLRVGVVGAGGTGSAVCEQLVRLGVRRLTLIDADVLSLSNVTRVYGSSPLDVGSAKVDVLAQHLARIAPDLVCDAHRAMVTLEPAARELTKCDLVFGCTDDNAGRLVLSRLSSYLLTPVIDVGVLLTTDADGLLDGIHGRVTVLSPGSACLVCRDRVDLARAAAELRTPDERRRLEDEGYAPALGAAEPAVVAFTTAVAAAAVNELLERLIGYGPSPRPGEVLLRWHEREISTNTAVPRAGHYCDPRGGKLGRGAGEPFLEQVWPGA